MPIAAAIILGIVIGGLIAWAIFGGGGGPHGTVPPPKASIDEVLARSVNVIAVSWTYPQVEPTTLAPITLPPRFEIARINPSQGTVLIPVPASGFQMSVDDVGLVPATSYSYRVRAAYSGYVTPWSESKSGSTLSFADCFGDTLTADEGGWEGRTLVQRIEAVRLNRSGTQVRLTLRASSSEDANIESIFISQHDPAGNDPYDSAEDLKFFYGKAHVAANTAVTLSDTLPDVNYNLDETRPLLIAVEFRRGLPSGIRFKDAVPPQEATAYFQAGAQGSLRDRTTGYSQASRIYLIEKIEVG